MIFNKSKKIVLEVFSPNGQLIDLFPPKKSNTVQPNWFKELSKENSFGSSSVLTVKNCPGIKDLYSSAITIPSWADYSITVETDKSINIDSPMEIPGGHSSVHRLGIQAPNAWPNYANVKFISPWKFYCSDPIKWMWVPATWDNHNPCEYQVIPGMLEFKAQHESNISALFPFKTHTYTVNIKAGDALAYLVPITERPWDIEIKMLTPEEWSRKIATWTHSFDFLYQRTRAILNKK